MRILENARLLEPRIAPSILSANFACLGDEVARLEKAGADWIHVDCMDGHFVPNLTIGPPVVKALRRATALPLDVHIMIADPDRYAEAFCEAGWDILTFHAEAAPNPVRTAEKIRRCGARPGLAIRPRTPIAGLDAAIAACDLVLVMTVEPGFGGQAFMADQVAKVEAAYARAGGRAAIEVDGGLDEKTVVACARAGANAIVAGSYIFRAQEPAVAIAALRRGVIENHPSSSQSRRQ